MPQGAAKAVVHPALLVITLKKPMGLDKGKIIGIVQLGFSLLAFILSIVALAGGVADNVSAA